MSKLIGEPVKGQIDKDSTLAAFIWRRRLNEVVEVLGWWREPSELWDGKPVRFFVRVNAENSSTGTFKLYQFGEGWFLHRVLD
jgi:hypothetical protein